MGTTLRWTSADLEVLHNDGKRYEIIDGDLYVSRQPGYHHQYACTQLSGALVVWSNHSLLGMEAYGVCWAVFSHLQCVCSVLEIILSLLEPLSGHAQKCIGLGHTMLFLLVKLVG